jgi:hypothetical protein
MTVRQKTQKSAPKKRQTHSLENATREITASYVDMTGFIFTVFVCVCGTNRLYS